MQIESCNRCTEKLVDLLAPGQLVSRRTFYLAQEIKADVVISGEVGRAEVVENGEFRSPCSTKAVIVSLRRIGGQHGDGHGHTFSCSCGTAGGSSCSTSTATFRCHGVSG